MHWLDKDIDFIFYCYLVKLGGSILRLIFLWSLLFQPGFDYMYWSLETSNPSLVLLITWKISKLCMTIMYVQSYLHYFEVRTQFSNFSTPLENMGLISTHSNG